MIRVLLVLFVSIFVSILSKFLSVYYPVFSKYKSNVSLHVLWTLHGLVCTRMSPMLFGRLIKRAARQRASRFANARYYRRTVSALVNNQQLLFPRTCSRLNENCGRRASVGVGVTIVVVAPVPTDRLQPLICLAECRSVFGIRGARTVDRDRQSDRQTDSCTWRVQKKTEAISICLCEEEEVVEDAFLSFFRRLAVLSFLCSFVLHSKNYNKSWITET